MIPAISKKNLFLKLNQKMKQIDKLKHQRYEISMQIIHIEAKSKLTKKEKMEHKILKKKETELDEKIASLQPIGK